MWDLIVSVPDQCLSFYFNSSFPEMTKTSLADAFHMRYSLNHINRMHLKVTNILLEPTCGQLKQLRIGT